MPAQPSTRKAKQKRLQVTDTAGWTHILKGSQAQKKQTRLTPMDRPRPTEVPHGLTVKQAGAILERYRKSWEASTHYAQVKDCVERQLVQLEVESIARCVCLGLGSMTGNASDESSWYQLAFLISMLEILGSFAQSDR
jgi:hypothetical protein